MISLVRTYNFQRIIRACDEARLNAQLAVIIGRNGQGVSTALKYYATKTPLQVRYFSFSQEETFKTFLLATLKQLQVRVDRPGDLHGMINTFSGEIGTSPSRSIIIFDHLPVNDEVLNFLINLRDQTKFRAFSISMIVRFRDAIDDNINYPQTLTKFRKLVNTVVKVSRPTKDEVRDLSKLSGVDDWETVYLNSKNFTMLFETLNVNYR